MRGSTADGLRGARELSRFIGDRAERVRPRFPASFSYFGWSTHQVALADRAHEWWFATGQGLCRFPAVANPAMLARTAPKAVYTRKDGLPGDDIFRLFEDSRGDIWIATVEPGVLSRWERRSGHIYADVIPRDLVQVIGEDAAGGIWVGTYNALLRLRGGKAEAIEGGPERVSVLYTESAGRLWAGGGQGLVRCDNPGAERPQCQPVMSVSVRCIVEDRFGNLYIGTGRGLDRLDPLTGAVRRHYTTADGLAPGDLQSAARDATGDLWFATRRGVSRFIPEQRPKRPASAVLFTGLRIAGRKQPIAELGAARLAGFRLQPDQNSFDVTFAGLSYLPGEILQYQYLLEGAGKDWSAPAAQRTITFASLRPGSYRLLVCAIIAGDRAGSPGASLAFEVLRPVWQRAWFLALMTALSLAALFGWHRLQVIKAVALERVRTRIAADLHDDLGASLTRIAIQSELVRKRAQVEEAALKDIAATSREMVSSMSDIVWAINPGNDRLSDLVQRMRWFAGQTCAAAGVELAFDAGGAAASLCLDPNTRRQLLLIFKEALDNSLRHSATREISIRMYVERGILLFELRDTGNGFGEDDRRGHGLRSMGERARLLGAKLDICGAKGEGTSVHLALPLRRGT